MLRRRSAVGVGLHMGQLLLGFEGRRSLQSDKEERAFQAEGNTQKKAQRCEKICRESRTRRPNQSKETLCENQGCCLTGC